MALTKKFKFNEEQSARMMGMSLRTFRRMTGASYLSIPATELVVRLSELYEIGIDTFGSAQSFIMWINTNSIALGDYKPVWLIESGMGVEFVKDELMRMQYGMLC